MLNNELNFVMSTILYLEPKQADEINGYLNLPNNTAPEGCLGEDTTISHSVKFPDGRSMDIKCCGVQYHEWENNSAWCEAVLFDENGCELTCSDVEDEYMGTWELEYKNTKYVVTVDINPNN